MQLLAATHPIEPEDIRIFLKEYVMARMITIWAYTLTDLLA
jgi:hypothetical protein